jgi:thiamine pyrophosphokinase
MSSHHIVKDKQEPALIIANGASCKFELLEQLLGWSPFVVVLDGAIERVLDLGIKVDVLLGDFDRGEVDLEKIKKDQFPIEIIHTPDQEKTDLEKGIEFLIKRGFPAVNILWATGLRMDHTLANVFNLIKYKNQIKLILLDDHSKIIPLNAKEHAFEKWYAAGSVISLLPLPRAEGICTSNLKYNIRDGELEIGGRLGNSNEADTNGIVSISYESGELMLLECID